jgi:hypothetical protein
MTAPVPDAASPAMNKSESPGNPMTIGIPVSTKRIKKIPANPNEFMADSALKAWRMSIDWQIYLFICIS